MHPLMLYCWMVPFLFDWALFDGGLLHNPNAESPSSENPKAKCRATLSSDSPFAVFFDFKAAFPSVSNTILWEALRTAGFSVE